LSYSHHSTRCENPRACATYLGRGCHVDRRFSWQWIPVSETCSRFRKCRRSKRYRTQPCRSSPTTLGLGSSPQRGPGCWSLRILAPRAVPRNAAKPCRCSDNPIQSALTPHY